VAPPTGFKTQARSYLTSSKNFPEEIWIWKSAITPKHLPSGRSWSSLLPENPDRSDCCTFILLQERAQTRLPTITLPTSGSDIPDTHAIRPATHYHLQVSTVVVYWSQKRGREAFIHQKSDAGNIVQIQDASVPCWLVLPFPPFTILWPFTDPFLVELAKSARAGCTDTLCKKEGKKIAKGELRFGSWVELDAEHGSWKWKHW
jgi:hypothetical protein